MIMMRIRKTAGQVFTICIEYDLDEQNDSFDHPCRGVDQNQGGVGLNHDHLNDTFENLVLSGSPSI